MTVDMAQNDRIKYKYANNNNNGPPPPPMIPQQAASSNNAMIGQQYPLPPQPHCAVNQGSHAAHYGPPLLAKSAPLADDELLKLGPQDLIGRLRNAESKSSKLMVEQGALVKDANQRIQMYLMEIRGLKEVNMRLQDDNQELRDLCCFLDDDRQKGRKLAREWQRFGRYTASVMRQEVSTYQGKLQELEKRQQELIKDNVELKELCLYLDEERTTNRGLLCSHCGLPVTHGQRDEGDGSSSSTNNDESPAVMNYNLGGQYSTVWLNNAERAMDENPQKARSVMNEQLLNYIRGLERTIHQLEGERGKTSIDPKPLHPPPYRKPPCPSSEAKNLRADDFVKPEAVVHAMKVLEVHEQLDKPLPSNCSSSSEVDELVEGEKALVREMCNVVWRKLEDGVDRR